MAITDKQVEVALCAAKKAAIYDSKDDYYNMRAALEAAEAVSPDLCERICAAIKAADDKGIDEADYMLDSNDCIRIVREQFAAAPSSAEQPAKAYVPAQPAGPEDMAIYDRIAQRHLDGVAAAIPATPGVTTIPRGYVDGTAPSTPEADEQDAFAGSNETLCRCIDALLHMDALGALVPRGVGGHARTLLIAAASRIRDLEAAHAQSGAAPRPFGWAVLDKKGCTERVISRVHYEFAHIEPLIRSEPDPKELLAYLDREYKGAAPHRMVPLYTAPPADARDGEDFTICGQCSASFPMPAEPHCYCPACTRADSDRLSNMQSEYWSVTCFSTPTGIGDHGVGWRVSQDLGEGKGETVIAEIFNDDLRDALDLASKASAWPECSGDPACCPENEGYGCCKPNPAGGAK